MGDHRFPLDRIASIIQRCFASSCSLLWHDDNLFATTSYLHHVSWRLWAQTLHEGQAYHLCMVTGNWSRRKLFSKWEKAAVSRLGSRNIYQLISILISKISTITRMANAQRTLTSDLSHPFTIEGGGSLYCSSLQDSFPLKSSLPHFSGSFSTAHYRGSV